MLLPILSEHGVGLHALHKSLHRQGRIACTCRMVPMGNGCPEDGHNTVTKHLVYRPFKSVYGFRVEIPDQRCRGSVLLLIRFLYKRVLMP